MTDPASADPVERTDADATALAADLRDALRPLWRRFREHRTLSMGKAGILARLDRHGALTATDLAAQEHISHQAVANAVRELEELGLVARNPDPQDGRRMRITLSEAGAERLASERTAGQEWLVHAVAEGLSESERSTLAAAIPLLRRLDTEATR